VMSDVFFGHAAQDAPVLHLAQPNLGQDARLEGESASLARRGASRRLAG
jgi:hypothetical protein